MPDFLDELEKRIIIFDGAMGTMIQKALPDYECSNEELNLSNPQIIQQIHEEYLNAGADVIETNTFGANLITLKDFGLDSKLYSINKAGAKIARKAADKFQDKFVAGSIGPGTKMPSLQQITFEELEKSYVAQIWGLVNGGVDLLLIETCYDLLQTKAALSAVQKYFEIFDKQLPVMVQVTIEENGKMLLGTEIDAVVASLEPYDIITSLGFNCATGPKNMNEYLRYLSNNWNKFISCQPNAGLPRLENGKQTYDLTPKEFVETLKQYISDYGINIVGGCCGTNPEFIEELAKSVNGINPKKRNPVYMPSLSSLYSSVPIVQNPKPLLIGERMNVTTNSKEFKQMVVNEEYDKIVALAKQLVSQGSHALDLCVDLSGEKYPAQYYLEKIVLNLNKYIDVPLIIDSDNLENMAEPALRNLSGRTLINSVNLESGEKKLESILPIAKKYGASVIALTIDEDGMALTADKKIAIAKRIHAIAENYRFRNEDLFFDMLTLPISTGQLEYKDCAKETLEAIAKVKSKIPGCFTILGVSNISFGLKQYARNVLNSVFLHEAVFYGLDAAIVNPSKIFPLNSLKDEEMTLAKSLIYNRKINGKDALEAYIEHFAKTSNQNNNQIIDSLSLEDSIKSCIIDGLKEQKFNSKKMVLNELLEEARAKYQPFDIINKILLPAMDEVGILFGKGKLQLPFVLKSADVMKEAVAYLESYLPKNQNTCRGKIVLATVKGDVHDIGKNLVNLILSNNGYMVHDLGIKQSSDSIIHSAIQQGADAIWLSGLLVKSLWEMKNVVEDLAKMNLSYPVICGGTAVSKQYVERDLRMAYQSKGPVYYAKDAFEGIAIMDKLQNQSTRKSFIDEGKDIV